MKKIGLFLVLIVLALVCYPAPAKDAVSDIKINVLPDRIAQGECFWVKVSPFEEIRSVTGEAFGRQVPFFPHDGAFRAIIPVPANAVPGKYRLNISIEQMDGARSEITRYILAARTGFGSVSFRLKPSKAGLLSAEVIEDDWARIEKEVTRATVRQIWSGPFRRPAPGIVTMKFGTHQKINGIPYGQHRGLDIAGKTYYRIRAANHGQVVFADYTQSMGNVVVINHGQGVFSLYLHMSRILVKKNDVVWKGKMIGMMGTTGVSTGVHLHFAMSVNNVRVDPLQWLYGGVGW